MLDSGNKFYELNRQYFNLSLIGDIEFAVNKVNAEEGEFGGVFVSKQPGE